MNNIPLNACAYLVGITFTFLSVTGCSVSPSNPERGNTVITRLISEPDVLNPMLSNSGYTSQIVRHLLPPLIEFHPFTLELTPVLCKSLPVEAPIDTGKYAGGIAYTYELLDEAKWEDGSAVTAWDYLFTIKAIYNPKVSAAIWRANIPYIREVTIDPDNPKNFTVLTDQKYILGNLATGNWNLYPEYLYDPDKIMRNFDLHDLTDAEKSRQLAETDSRLDSFAISFENVRHAREKGFVSGAGPYRFEHWLSGQQIVLVKKENYWGDPLYDRYPWLTGKPDKIIFKPIPDESTALTSLHNQSVDVLTYIPPERFIELKKEDNIRKNYHLFEPVFMQYYCFVLNGTHPKLEDKRVRRALAHLFDLDKAIETVMYGLGDRIIGPFHPSKPYYHKDLIPIKFDLEQAKSLLAAAGWKDTDNNGIIDKSIDGEQVEMELTIKIGTGSTLGKDLAVFIQNSARKVGIAVEIAVQDFNLIRQDLKKLQFEIVPLKRLQGPNIDVPAQNWHTKSIPPNGTNYTGFGTAETDDLIDKIQTTMDVEARSDMYKQLQEAIYEEQPYIFLFAPREPLAIHKRFDTQASSLRPGFAENFFSLSEGI